MAEDRSQPLSSLLPRLSIVAAAALFSTGGAAIKATSLKSVQVAGFRSLVAAFALLLFLPAARARPTRRALLVGLAYAGTMVLFVTANKLTTSANTIFLQSTAPLYVLLVSPWLLKERIALSDLWFMGCVALGLSLFFAGSEQPLATAPNPLRGNLLATLSGVTWAGTILGLRWLSSSSGGSASALPLGNLLAFGCCLPFLLPLPALGLSDVLILLFLGVFQIAAAYALMTWGLKGVPALEASLLLLVEPVLNPLWAFWMHGERPGSLALLGGCLVLGATTARSFVIARRARQARAGASAASAR